MSGIQCVGLTLCPDISEYQWSDIRDQKPLVTGRTSHSAIQAQSNNGVPSFGAVSIDCQSLTRPSAF